jgi:hypothetical protein
LEHQHGFKGFQLEKVYGYTMKARNGSEFFSGEPASGVLPFLASLISADMM